MTLSTQFITMIAMICTGFGIGVLFETYNRLLKRSTKHRITVFINDILFWSVQALLAFFVLYKVNYGELRFYIFLALLCGFAAYESLFKSYYIRILEAFLLLISKTYKMMTKLVKVIVVRPLKTAAILTGTFLIIIIKGLWTLVKYIVIKLILLITFLLKIIFFPFKKIFQSLYNKFLKERLTKITKKAYNIYYKIKNIIKSFKKFFKK